MFAPLFQVGHLESLTAETESVNAKLKEFGELLKKYNLR